MLSPTLAIVMCVFFHLCHYVLYLCTLSLYILREPGIVFLILYLDTYVFLIWSLLITSLSLLCSPEEAARYLETYKAYEHKPAELLMERTDSDFTSQVSTGMTL